MSEEKLTMAERVRLAKAKVAAEGGPKIPEAPKPVSNMYSADETKLVSDDTAAKVKQAGRFAAMAGKAILEKGKEGVELAAIKAKAAMAEREAYKVSEAAQAARELAGREAQAADTELEAVAVEEPTQAIHVPENEPVIVLAPDPVVLPTPLPVIEDNAQIEIPDLVHEAADENEASEVATPIEIPMALPPVPIQATPQAVPVPRPVVRPAMTPVPEAWTAPETEPTRKRLPLILGGVVLAAAIGAGYWWTQRTVETTPAPTPVQSHVAPTPTVQAPAVQSGLIEQAPPAVAPTQPDMSAPVPVVEREPAAAYGMDEPVAEPKMVEAEPAKPAIEPAPTPVKKAAPVAPSKPKVSAPTQPAQASKASSLDKGIKDLEALEKQLGN